MKLISYSLFAAALGLTLTACNDDNPWQNSGSEGGLQITVRADADVTDAIPTRAAVQAPDVNEFTVRLTKNDATDGRECLVKNWDDSQGFSSGQYILEAFYGDENAEGYDSPYFYGRLAELVTIRPGDVTQASVTASLANTMVSITYTDAFKSYFTAYSARLHSEGHDYVNVDPTRDDAIYLVPGKVTIALDITKQNGKQTTIQPAEFTAEARHHYHVTLDINDGQVSEAQLVVTFDDTVAQEDVEIDMSDALFDCPAPEVTAVGFTPAINGVGGVPVDVLEQNISTDAPKFNIFAQGKMAKVTLTIESDTWDPAFGKEIDFIAAGSAEQAQLQAAGFKVLGLYHNPDQMAYIDMSDVLTNLPSGTHKFTLVVKDKYTRVNEPVTMIVNTESVIVSLLSAPSLPYGASEGTLQIEYNGQNLENDVTIEARGDNGVYQKCDIISAPKAKATRAAFPANTYNVTVSLPYSTDDMPVRVLYRGKEYASGTITMFAPNYSLQADAFAAKAYVYVTTDNAEDIPAVMKNLRFFQDGVELTSGVTLEPENKRAVLTNLSASSTYSLTSSAMKGNNPTMGASVSFTTEAKQQPENGNLDQWSSVSAYVGLRWFANSTADNSYWSTRNITTTAQTSGYWGGAGYDYTCKSGTFPVANGDGQAAQIETIGWGRGSTTAGAASIIKNISSGMLFMGYHDYTGKDEGSSLVAGTHTFDASKETIEFGRPFTSRPTSVSFDYKFTPCNSQNFKAFVVVENREGGSTVELARAELLSNTEVGSYTTYTFPLNYDSHRFVKATHAYIVFYSTDPDVTPAVNKVQLGGGYHKGNVLTVDNIVFNY